MQFLTTSEMRKPEAWESTHLDKALITSHGKPIAVILPVTGDDLEETLEMISRIEAMRALRHLHVQARQNGIETMRVADINREIAASRKERRERKPRRAHRA